MSKTLVIGTIAIVFLVFALVGLFLWQQSKTKWPPKDVVELPGTGILVYENRLSILGSGQDIQTIVKEFGGEITLSIPETDTYEARFPVSSLMELDEIKNQLNVRGVEADYSIVVQFPDCSKGPC